jgi:hypothetical protein
MTDDNHRHGGMDAISRNAAYQRSDGRSEPPRTLEVGDFSHNGMANRPGTDVLESGGGERPGRAMRIAAGIAVLAVGGVLAWTQRPGPASRPHDADGVKPPVATQSAPLDAAPLDAAPLLLERSGVIEIPEPSPALIVSDLAPAKRFVKGDRQKDGAARITMIIDKATIKNGEQRDLMLIKVTDQHSIPPADPDQPQPTRTAIANTKVTIGENGSVMEANWLQDDVHHILLWEAPPEQPAITNADIRWIIGRSIAGKL